MVPKGKNSFFDNLILRKSDRINNGSNIGRNVRDVRKLMK